MGSPDVLLYSIIVPTGVTLAVLLVSVALAFLVSVRRSGVRELDPPNVVRRPRRETVEGLAASIQESESLASVKSNPIADPIVHLRGAVRIAPTNYQDTAKKVLDHLSSKRVVILDLATVNDDLARRLVDFCSGVTLGARGWLYGVSSTTILLAPSTE